MVKIASTHYSYQKYGMYPPTTQKPVVSLGKSPVSPASKKTVLTSYSNVKTAFNSIKKFFNALIKKDKAPKAKKLITRHGTILDGAQPLPDFWREINELKKRYILKSGISTNSVGQAYAVLKSKPKNPLSTSFVQDCSVIYLYNKKTQTHFLYHLYPKTSITELNKVIDKFVPEGYTKACVIPGYEYFRNTHKKYLPKVINLLKTKEPNAGVKIFYSKTPHPEIVGYNGNVYEIENKHYLNGKLGKATFKISNIFSYDIFHSIGACKNMQDIKKLKYKFHKAGYDKTIYKVLNEMIKEHSKNFNQSAFDKYCQSFD